IYRNLWKQWLSYLYYMRRGNNYYYDTTVHYMALSQDHFLTSMTDFYVRRALDFRLHRSDEEHQPLVKDERIGLLFLLPESQAFGMFMALHLYLYLHAQLSADLTVD